MCRCQLKTVNDLFWNDKRETYLILILDLQIVIWRLV